MTNGEFRMANSEKKEGRTPALVLAGVLLCLDQIAKRFFFGSARAYCNPDGPWGIAADNGVMIGVMIVILAGVGYWLWRKICHSRGGGNPDGCFFQVGKNDRETWIPAFVGMTIQEIAMVLIFAGGLSNLVDRVVFGCVRDFAFVPWFPAFNPADVFLTIGVVLFLTPVWKSGGVVLFPKS